MKKTISMLLALCMAFSLALSISAFAAEADDMIVTGSGTFTAKEAAERALAWQECSNLAGKHEYYHTALEHRAELDNIWVTEEPWTETMSWTNNSQYMLGRDNVYAFYCGVEQETINWLNGAISLDESGTINDGEDWLKTGLFWYHMLMSPVIEVARDGQTACGLWQSFGTTTGPQGAGLGATWTCEDYTMVFAKQSAGDWKIWHLRTFVHFYTDVDNHWYEQNQASASKLSVEGYDEIRTQNNAAAAEGESPEGESPEGESPEGESPEGPMGPPPGMEDQNYAINGIYYIGYSLYRVPIMATIPEPYDTWDDIKDTFAWGGDMPMQGNNALHQEVLDMQ